LGASVASAVTFGRVVLLPFSFARYNGYLDSVSTSSVGLFENANHSQ
jgi:hypothetical protein